MTTPARSGVLIYAKQFDSMSAFYQRVLGAQEVHADAQHRVLRSADAELILHAIPPHIAAEISIESPPLPREEQAIKPFFTVASLAEAERVAVACGGRVLGPIWPGPGLRVRNVCDPEGNILHLRERLE
ncbi:VOC family protein [Aquimonas sp.]|jgi:predicted enzyme related to lactoylglutathione lyase|uniref:VOC family protein n=1 Tax=Aquimonas sp. TaxID=1872588 RepID=UPI0037C0E8C5